MFGGVGLLFRAVLTALNDGEQTQPLCDSRGRLLVASGGAGEYETVAASQTAQAIGGTGAAGDYIDKILVVPATTTPGVVTLLDGATSIPIFVGGALSVADLKPFEVPLGLYSANGPWKLTTGANVSAIAYGDFTA